MRSRRSATPTLSSNRSTETAPVVAQAQANTSERVADEGTLLDGLDPDGILFDHESSGASDTTARGQGTQGTGVTASENMADEDLGRVLQSKDAFEKVAKEMGLPPSLLAAIASRETRGGNQLREDGFSQWDGHGYGIMQVDRRYHEPTGDPGGEAHIRQAAGILARFRDEIADRFPSWTPSQQLQGGVYAYNAGPSSVESWATIDQYSTGGDYSSDVWARARQYAPHFGGELPQTESQRPSTDDSEQAWEEHAESMMQMQSAFDLIVEGRMTASKTEASALADAVRDATGTTGHDHPLAAALGKVWTAADRLQQTQEALSDGDTAHAKIMAHEAAESCRFLRDGDWVEGAETERLIEAAGGYWTQAHETEQASKPSSEESGQDHGNEPNASANFDRQAYTTGRPYPGADVISTPMYGDIQSSDFLEHHSDRSNSWAANQIRGGVNQDIQAYDFTFLDKNEQGNIIDGSQLGLPMITPWDAKVLDVQRTFQGSGGLGKFVRLEDLETGYRLEIHHLDSVYDHVQVGQDLDGGEAFGTQGGSGNYRDRYPVHIDIVGEQEPVTDFVRANASGEFRTRRQ